MQNSFMLLLICALYRQVFAPDARIINDCHNKSLRRDTSGLLGFPFRWLKRWSFRQVDLVLVSNPRLIADAAHLCPMVKPLRDPLPRLAAGPLTEGREPYVLFVCSFESDEPVDLVFAAAVAITERSDLGCVITGSTSKIAKPAVIESNQKISMPGYLPRDEYESLLKTAVCVISLTEDHDCLPCSAYEAISAERPLVLSSTLLLRTVFEGLAFFVNHDPYEIARNAIQAAQNVPTGCRVLRRRFVSAWQREMNDVIEAVEDITNQHAGTRRQVT